MRLSKKSLHSHILVLIMISFVMSVFLFLIVDYVYKPDNPSCEFVEFNVKNQCKDGKNLKAILENKGEKLIYYQVNDEPVDSLKNKIEIKDSMEIRVPIRDSSVEIFPVVRDISTYHACRGKRKVINTEVLIKC